MARGKLNFAPHTSVLLQLFTRELVGITFVIKDKEKKKERN